MSDLEVYHGDCFERLAELPDKSVDLILTDPPYGHRNNDGDLIHAWEAVFGGSPAREEARPIDNDGEEANELVRRLFAEAARVLKRPGSCCCCGGGGGPDPQFARWSLWMGEVLDFVQQIVWDKGPMGMGKDRECHTARRLRDPQDYPVEVAAPDAEAGRSVRALHPAAHEAGRSGRGSVLRVRVKRRRREEARPAVDRVRYRREMGQDGT